MQYLRCDTKKEISTTSHMKFVYTPSSDADTGMELFGLNIFADFDLVGAFVTLALCSDLPLFDTFSALASFTDLATFAIWCSFRVFDLADLPDLPNNGTVVVIIL
jgi:hypothetical protein